MNCNIATYAHINSGNDDATLCKNLVNFGSVTPEIMRVQCAIFAVTWPQFTDTLSFGTVAFQNRLEYRNSDSTRLIGDNFSILCRKLIRFDLMTPYFCQNVYSMRLSFYWVSLKIKVKVKEVYSSLCYKHLTATGNHVLYGITQCYLPPGSGDIPTFTPANYSWYSI